MNVPDALIFNDEPIHVMKNSGGHQYLGRKSSGDLTKFRHMGFQHRVPLVWVTFNHFFRATLTNKYVFIKFRLRSFDAIVTPTILFGLTTMPFTTSDLNQLDAIQRRMLSSSIKWVRVHDEPCKNSMIRMNEFLRSVLH